jgi:hypothetical protein
VKIVVVKLGTDPGDKKLEVVTPKKNIVKKKKTIKPKELAEFVEEVVKKGRFEFQVLFAKSCSSMGVMFYLFSI